MGTSEKPLRTTIFAFIWSCRISRPCFSGRNTRGLQKSNTLEQNLIDNGNITEGSASNAWIIKNSNTIVTHPANNKILRGVTRDTIIKILKKNSFNIKEKPFNLIEAKNAKEAFLTSSTLSVLPVVKIDNYNISNGKPGDITKKIINLYNNYICKNKITLSKELKIA